MVWFDLVISNKLFQEFRYFKNFVTSK